MTEPTAHNVSLTTVSAWWRKRRWLRVQCSAGCLDVLYPHSYMSAAVELRDRHQTAWSRR